MQSTFPGMAARLSQFRELPLLRDFPGIACLRSKGRPQANYPTSSPCTPVHVPQAKPKSAAPPLPSMRLSCKLYAGPCSRPDPVISVKNENMKMLPQHLRIPISAVRTWHALALGTLANIDFNNAKQQWEVKDRKGKVRLFARSRSACLDWEQENLQPE